MTVANRGLGSEGTAAQDEPGSRLAATGTGSAAEGGPYASSVSRADTIDDPCESLKEPYRLYATNVGSDLAVLRSGDSCR